MNANVIPIGSRRPHQDREQALRQIVQCVMSEDPDVKNESRNTEHAATDEQALTALLAKWQAPEPAVKAQELLTWFRARSWRPMPGLNTAPDTGPPTPPYLVHDRAAAVRQALREETP